MNTESQVLHMNDASWQTIETEQFSNLENKSLVFYDGVFDCKVFFSHVVHGHY